MRLSQAPAKINLALHVTGQREDGYHTLDSIVVFADTINASDTLIASAATRDGFDVTGEYDGNLSSGKSNLVMRARDHVRKSAASQNAEAPPVHISLEKRLPVAGGLGGGSADAAAVVKMLHAHWALEYHADYSSPDALAQALGADVPMCLFGSPLRATGIGEKITRLAHIPALHMVLVNCGHHVSTPHVFDALETKDNPAIFDLAEQDFVGWLKERTRNDLAEPAIGFCPPIQNTMQALVAHGAQMARMSGSGATCYGIFDSAKQAGNAARAIKSAQPHWWVVATRTGASPLPN